MAPSSTPPMNTGEPMRRLSCARAARYWGSAAVRASATCCSASTIESERLFMLISPAANSPQLPPRCREQQIPAPLDHHKHEAAGARKAEQRRDRERPPPADDVVLNEGQHDASQHRKPPGDREHGGSE